MTDTDDVTAELERLRAKNRELLAELKTLKEQHQTVGATATEQAARLRRYELDGPIERVIAEAALPDCAQAWRTLFEQAFDFRLGEDGQIEVIAKATGEPAVLPTQPGTKGRERERPARLERGDLIELTCAVPGMDRITQAHSRGSGSSAGGSRPAGRAPAERHPDSPEKGGETSAAAPLGLR